MKTAYLTDENIDFRMFCTDADRGVHAQIFGLLFPGGKKEALEQHSLCISSGTAIFSSLQ